ncbi:MAG: MBL fold metallo-hydrolase [Alphaproteobacteria bacterium]|nr:MBL fold metallo-hydrolase [Alphaproteobacteria bacterium]
MKITILGCGSSMGVPVLGEGWGDCDPAEPRNRRLRASILVEEGPTRLLVDTSPDLRQQLLAAGVTAIDAILYTHAHADHLHGIDDIRAINVALNGPLDAYADTTTLDIIRDRFGYVFQPLKGDYYYKPTLTPHVIDGPFHVGAVEVRPFRQDHGFSHSLGFRFGRAAYSTDVLNLDEQAFEVLAGVDLWIVDAFRLEPHETHTHLARTLEWIERVRPRRAVLTHMSQRVDYARVKAMVPDHVEPAYDGMVIECP